MLYTSFHVLFHYPYVTEIAYILVSIFFSILMAETFGPPTVTRLLTSCYCCAPRPELSSQGLRRHVLVLDGGGLQLNQIMNKFEGESSCSAPCSTCPASRAVRETTLVGGICLWNLHRILPLRCSTGRARKHNTINAGNSERRRQHGDNTA